MLSPKQRQKRDLILKIQAQHHQGKGFRTLARDYHLSRKTIKRYVRAVDAVVSRYPAVLECQRFYREFRQNLTGLDPVALLNQLSCPHEAPCLKHFIDSLRKDWQAVLNAAAYAFSNGIAESTVNKIKQVKGTCIAGQESICWRRRSSFSPNILR